MDESRSIVVENDGYVTTVTLNQPGKKNALSREMFQELKVVFDDIAEDDSVRSVIVTGAGGNFCSGADLSDPGNHMTSSFETADRMRAIHALALAIIDCPKPTIAKVTGVAAGAGANLAFGCDLLVTTPEARFIEVFVRRGLVVDFGGSWSLVRQLPLNKAKELALLGDEIDGTRANDLGLVNRLCSADEIDAVAAELAHRIAALPPRTVSLIKRNLNRASERKLVEVLEDEGAGQALCFTSEDTREAVTAFLEKRDPRFVGR